MTTGSRRVWAAGLITAVALAGCQAEPADRDARPTLTAASPATSSVDPKKAAKTKALEAYRGMWRAYMAATRAADPDHPDLSRYSSGEALKILQKGLRQIRDQGLRGKGNVKLNPAVDKLEPETAPTVAFLGDCVDTSGSSLYKTNGEPYKDTPGGKRALSATVKDVGGGTWKVTSFGLREVGTCE